MKRDSFFQLYDLNERQFSFRGLRLIGFLYFGSLLFAAMVAPLVFRLVHVLDPETQSYLANKPFTDFFDRGRILCLLILFPVLIKRANLWSWNRLGFLSPGWVHFRKWFLIGMGMMLLVYLIDLFFGAIQARGEWSLLDFLEHVGSALVGALLIGFLEELLFRGFVFRTFYTAMRPLFAVLLSSLFFAYLHFKMADEVLAHVPAHEIGIDDGLFAIWASLTAFSTGFDALLFFNLFLVGVLLHLAFVYSRNLWACVGLHAGWVVMIKIFSRSFNETTGVHPFFGTERVADGYLVSIFLMGFIGIAMRLVLVKKNSSFK